MITEDYVSFETAKLLKEKGFDEECFALYNPDGVLIQSGIRLNNIQVGRVKGSYSAPTLQMAMKWLREMPKIAYNIFIYADGGDSGLLEYIYEIQEIDNELMCVNGSLDTDNNRYEFYKEACEAAIRYCLENLI